MNMNIYGYVPNLTQFIDVKLQIFQFPVIMLAINSRNLPFHFHLINAIEQGTELSTSNETEKHYLFLFVF